MPAAFAPNSPFYRSAYRVDDPTRVAEFHWNPLVEEYDVIADGSVRILPTPGRTPGHLSLLVRLDRGWLLLTGDATHRRCGLDRTTPMGADHSTNQSVDSPHRIRQLASGYEAEVWINHDRADWKRYGRGPVVLAARGQERTTV